jgi:hypothetical protein
MIVKLVLDIFDEHRSIEATYMKSIDMPCAPFRGLLIDDTGIPLEL